jgi:hypothetical protein
VVSDYKGANVADQEAMRLEREAARERVKSLQPHAQQCLAYEQQVGFINESLSGGEQISPSAVEEKMTLAMQEFLKPSAQEPASRVVELLQPHSHW